MRPGVRVPWRAVQRTAPSNRLVMSPVSTLNLRGSGGTRSRCVEPRRENRAHGPGKRSNGMASSVVGRCARVNVPASSKRGSGTCNTGTGQLNGNSRNYTARKMVPAKDEAGRASSGSPKAASKERGPSTARFSAEIPENAFNDTFDFGTLTGKVLCRRDFLRTSAASVASTLLSHSIAPNALAGSGDWSSPGLASPEDPNMPKFVKLDSGVYYQSLDDGVQGKAAEVGDSVSFDYVLRRNNGYFIYSTVEGVSFQPKDLPTGPVDFKLGAGQMVPGLEEAILGMRAGSRRRILVPPSQGYDEALKLGPAVPGFAARRQVINHRTESLIFEVEMLKVRPGS